MGTNCDSALRKQPVLVTRQNDKNMIVNNVEFTCLMSKVARVKDTDTSTSWLVDSACTAHITFDMSWFETYKTLSSTSVKMRTKANAKVAGCGDVYLKINVNGGIQPCKLNNVLHNPDFAFSLSSVSQMAELELNVEFMHGNCDTTRENEVVAPAILVGEL